MKNLIAENNGSLIHNNGGKNMVQAYSNNITVNAKSAVPFNNVVLSKGCTTDL